MPWRSQVALLLLCGCGAEESFFARLPSPETALSVVFALESEDEIQIEARAVDDGAVPPVTIEFDRLGRSVLWVLYYDRTLSEIGLAEGRVTARDDGGPLDPPDRIRRSAFLGGELGEWVTESALSERIRELDVERAPRDPICPVLEDELDFSLETRGDGAFALRADGDRALVGTTDGRLFLVTVAGVTPLGFAPTPIESGFLAANGELIVGGAGGRTFRGPFEPELGLVEIARGESRDSFRWIDGPANGEELFAVTSSGALEHFDGTSWRVLVAPQGEDWKRGVAWIAPNEAVAVGLSAPILRATEGAVKADSVDAIDSFTAVEHAPGLGTFAGTLTGTLFMDGGDRWEPIPGSPIELPASAIAAFERGILVSGGTGQSALWLPGYGFCERFSVNSPIVKHLAVLDGAVVFLGDARDNTADPTSVSIRRLR